MIQKRHCFSFLLIHSLAGLINSSDALPHEDMISLKVLS
jgi:hypothetical protein